MTPPLAATVTSLPPVKAAPVAMVPPFSVSAPLPMLFAKSAGLIAVSGFVADRLIGYQRSILLGAVIMGLGLFTITMPNQQIFILARGAATIGSAYDTIDATGSYAGRAGLADHPSRPGPLKTADE